MTSTKKKTSASSAGSKTAERKSRTKATKKAAKEAANEEPEKAPIEPPPGPSAEAPTDERIETPSEAPTKAATKAATKGTKKATRKEQSNGATFADMASGYLSEIEERGCSESTVTGYRAELRLAASVLGEEKALSELTAEEIAKFLACDAVTLTRHGLPKSRLSTDRTARVLRQALAWAQEHEMVEAAPIPAENA